MYAVDADPLTAAMAAANAEAAGLAEGHAWSAPTPRPSPVERFDAVFGDPARRRAGRGRVFDPKSYSPPWDFVARAARAGAAHGAEARTRASTTR